MAQIDTSIEGLTRLVGRLTREYGETAAANFALDEQLNLAGMQIHTLLAQVEDQNAAIIGFNEQVAAMGVELDKLRRQADPDPAHSHRYVRSTRKPRPKRTP